MMLAVPGLATLNVGHANAASANAVTIYWVQNQNSQTAAPVPPYQCGLNMYTYQNDVVGGITNNCTGRAWLHNYDYATGKTLATKCINPGGTAYAFGSAGYNSVQTTMTTDPCDPNQQFEIAWGTGNIPLVTPTYKSYSCAPGTIATLKGNWVGQVFNDNDPGPAYGCNVRIWVHVSDNGTGGGDCISPGKSSSYVQLQFWQAEVSDNQVACGINPPIYMS